MTHSDSFDTTVNIKRLKRTSENRSTKRGALDIRVSISRRSTGGGSNGYSARLGFAKLGAMKLGET